MGGVFRALLVGMVVAAAPLAVHAQTIEPYRNGDRTAGSATAPVTLTAYISTTCSHCADWHTKDYPAFKSKYVDTGKVRVVYRDLATQPGPLSIAGATLARCAADDRYETVLDVLFRGQATYFPQNQARQWLVAGAMASGLTPTEAQACLSPANIQATETRVEQSSNDGVDGTPSFFINGRRVLAASASHDVDAFAALIDPLLAER